MQRRSDSEGRSDKRLSVLVADDVEALRRLVRRILERDGRFEVVAEACDGVEAVELAERFRPDLVLLDLMMPRKDGAQALGEIRSLSPTSRIVLFSGAGEGAMEGLGADVHLSKGIPAADIISSLERFVA